VYSGLSAQGAKQDRDVQWLSYVQVRVVYMRRGLMKGSAALLRRVSFRARSIRAARAATVSPGGQTESSGGGARGSDAP